MPSAQCGPATTLAGDAKKRGEPSPWWRELDDVTAVQNELQAFFAIPSDDPRRRFRRPQPAPPKGRLGCSRREGRRPRPCTCWRTLDGRLGEQLGRDRRVMHGLSQGRRDLSGVPAFWAPITALSGVAPLERLP